MTVAIVSAIFGSYDEARPQAEQDIPVDWIMVSDDRKLDPPKPWHLEVESPRHRDPIMAAKFYKMVPDLPHRYVIWIDGNTEITSSSFAQEAIEAINDSGMATWRHPRRHCIYKEAEASLGKREGQGGRYAKLPIRDQMRAYLIEGHPKDWGLYACGIIAWNRKAGSRLGKVWLAECQQWGHQDQLSLPVVCRRLGAKPGVFPLRQVEGKDRYCLYNRWNKLWPHQASQS